MVRVSEIVRMSVTVSVCVNVFVWESVGVGVGVDACYFVECSCNLMVWMAMCG